MRAVLRAQINKADRNDARGMAQMMRTLTLKSVRPVTKPEHLAKMVFYQWNTLKM